jgi:hypothetical protein
MGNSRKSPRWTIAFLRALGRTGSVEAAARDSGIDKTTAYARRKAHADFAGAWDAALRLRSGRAEEEMRERVGFWERLRGKVTPKVLGSSAASLDGTKEDTPFDKLRTNGAGGGKEDLLATTALGGQIKRVGPGRWTEAAEARFFEALAATANVKRAAAAAGVSANAVYARRMKRADFRAKWDAVLETGRSAIEMHLVEAAKKSFDPDDLDTGDVEPKVSVAEAIRIVQLHGSKTQRQSIDAVEPPEDEVAAIREPLVQKLQRLRNQMIPEMIAEGWSYDEAHDHMVPPGWVRTDGASQRDVPE